MDRVKVEGHGAGVPDLKARRLYVIGNGFDLHYGVRSSYKDYLEFLLQRDARVYDLFVEIFPATIWKNFEEGLGGLGPGSLNYDFFGLLDYDEDSDYAFEQQSAAWSYHYEAMAEELDFSRIHETFADWAKQIDISFVMPDGVVEDSEDVLYLTFNYTRTLEERFGVDACRVLHVHGVVGDDDLVVGHAPIENSEMIPVQAFAEQDNLEQLRISFIEQTEKPVNRLISYYEEWFERLSDVSEVIVAGFSFSEVDLPYIQRIVDSVSPSAKWTVFVCDNSAKVEKPIIGMVDATPYPK